MQYLLAFWLHGVAAGIAVALALLLWLRNAAAPAIQAPEIAVANPIVAQIQVAVGVLAVLIAARVWARHRAPVHVIDDTPSNGAIRADRRLSIRGRLESGSLTVVFVAGLALATPPVEYLAVLITILASSATAAAQLAAALTFTLVAFAVVEVPLISYLATPANSTTNWRTLTTRNARRLLNI
jgi:hypothetical protein